MDARHVALAILCLGLGIAGRGAAQTPSEPGEVAPESPERPAAVDWVEPEAEPAEEPSADDDAETTAPAEAIAPPPPPTVEAIAPPPPAPAPCGARAHAAAAASVVRVRSGGQWGAGFVYRDATTVVTSFSLLRLGRPIRVVGRDGTSVEARLLARDEAVDLALLELDAPLPGAPPLVPAPETSAVLGAEVVAIGHHFTGAAAALGERGEGLLRWSITLGHVGAVNGQGIQADLAVSVGNAGGPLLDCDGRVLGSVAGAGLLSQDLALVTRIGRADELLDEQPRAGDFFGDLRLRLGLGGALLIDEEGRTAAGGYLILGAVLFDRVSWINRVGLFFGGLDDPTGADLSVDRQMVRVESLLGWRFFVDLFGLTNLYIVPAGGVSVIYETVSTRSAAVTPMCTPSDTEPCLAFTESSTDQWIVRPAIGLTFIPGGNLEIGYVLEIGLETDPVETYHSVRLGLGF